MKKLLFASAILAMTLSTSFAQSANDELGIIQELFGMEKKAAIAGFLQLEDNDSDPFWEVYEAYEVERKALGKKRMDLLNKYADQYIELNDEKTEALMKDMGESPPETIRVAIERNAKSLDELIKRDKEQS